MPLDAVQAPTGRVTVNTREQDRRHAPAAQVQVFDACHAGVLLRAVLGMAAVLLVGATFMSPRLDDLLLNHALLVALATPGLFAWLLVCCLCKALLARLPMWLQLAGAVVLGAVAAWLSYGVGQWLGLASKGFGLAFGLAGALMAAVLVAALYWRAKAQMPAATQARLVELQSRIRPHFLFNALNSAIALVRDEPAKAERVLEDLSDLFRQALAESGRDVSLAEELALAKSYLSVEQIRFGDRMQVEWAIDPDTEPARVPPLILQPLVENAVKHGVERSTGTTHIKVSTQRRRSVAVLRVTNSAPPDAQTDQAGNGMALANVRERLALLHDVKASFRAQHKDGVFQARIEVPLP